MLFPQLVPNGTPATAGTLSESIMGKYGKRSPTFKDLTDQVFDKLTVQEYIGTRGKSQNAYWRCVCVCGGTTEASTNALTGLKVRSCSPSCGQLRHGGTSRVGGRQITPEWRAWSSMKTRCYNEKHKAYKNYGGRGIKVCERWLVSYENFLADMGPRPSPRHSLERRDNAGDYSPENCVWATKQAQARNKRTTHFVTLNGESKSLAAWSEVLGLKADTIMKRLRNGWSEFDALTTPLVSLEESARRAGLATAAIRKSQVAIGTDTA